MLCEARPLLTGIHPHYCAKDLDETRDVQGTVPPGDCTKVQPVLKGRIAVELPCLRPSKGVDAYGTAATASKLVSRTVAQLSHGESFNLIR